MRVTLLLLATLGCTGSDVHSAVDMAPSAMRLIGGNYSLAAGEERFVCMRQTVASDLFITEITPVNGAATHHQVLGIDTTKAAPDGTSDCGSNIEFNVLQWKMLFASGVNSPSLTIPDGAALKIAADQ